MYDQQRTFVRTYVVFVNFLVDFSMNQELMFFDRKIFIIDGYLGNSH